MAHRIDNGYLLRQHIKKVCVPSLKNEKVSKCATCPFEDEIVEERPDLKELFIVKRSLRGMKTKYK